jgi:hypothetical protein
MNADKIILHQISYPFVSCFLNYVADRIDNVKGPHFAHR